MALLWVAVAVDAPSRYDERHRRARRSRSRTVTGKSCSCTKLSGPRRRLGRPGGRVVAAAGHGRGRRVVLDAPAGREPRAGCLNTSSATSYRLDTSRVAVVRTVRAGRRGVGLGCVSQGVGRLPRMPPFRLVSDFSPAGDQPKAIAELTDGHRGGRPVPDAARHHRLGQERHHRLDHREGAAAHAGARAQQVAGRPAGQRVPGVLPREPGRVLRLLLRLLPARGVHRRPPTPTSRRTRRSTTRSTGCATRPPRPCSPGATPSSWPRCRASTASARPTSTRTSSSPCAPGEVHDQRAILRQAWSTCSTSATT